MGVWIELRAALTILRGVLMGLRPVLGSWLEVFWSREAFYSYQNILIHFLAAKGVVTEPRPCFCGVL
jgi:hypothetical protein